MTNISLGPIGQIAPIGDRADGSAASEAMKGAAVPGQDAARKAASKPRLQRPPTRRALRANVSAHGQSCRTAAP